MEQCLQYPIYTLSDRLVVLPMNFDYINLQKNIWTKKFILLLLANIDCILCYMLN